MKTNLIPYLLFAAVAVAFLFASIETQKACYTALSIFKEFLNKTLQNYTDFKYNYTCNGNVAQLEFSLYYPEKNLKIYGTAYVFDNKVFVSYFDVKKGRYVLSINFKKRIVIPKREKPEIIFGTMSFCPSGNEAENRLLNLLEKYIDENKIDFKVVYIISKICENETLDCFSSLHGKEELLQDIREYCVYEHFGFKKWKNFVLEINKECSLVNLSTCWKEVAKKIGLDINKIEECVEREGVKIADEMYNLSMKYRIFASPTLIINGVKIEGLRSDYEDLIKQAFK